MKEKELIVSGFEHLESENIVCIAVSK